MKIFAIFISFMLALLAFVSADISSVSNDDIPDADCMCPRMMDPVCGNDSITYPNRCEFVCAQKKFARKGRSIAIAHAGRC